MKRSPRVDAFLAGLRASLSSAPPPAVPAPRRELPLRREADPRALDRALEELIAESAGAVAALQAEAESMRRLDEAWTAGDPVSRLDRLFASAQALAAAPEDGSVRSRMLEAARELARGLNRLAGHGVELDLLAGALAAEFNRVQASGIGLDATGSTAFFSGTRAADLAVETALAHHPRRLAAARSRTKGDPANALAFAALRDLAALDGRETFIGFCRAFADGFRSRAANLRERLRTEELHLRQLQSLRGTGPDGGVFRWMQLDRVLQSSSRGTHAAEALLTAASQGF